MSDADQTPGSHERADEFLRILQDEVTTFRTRVSTDNGDWIVRGFIDVFRQIYTISGDTKVVSKLIELMLLPCFGDFGNRHGLGLVPAREQNQYPDLSFIAQDGARFALDLKSTYRRSADRCNTMTLGTYRGYFRDRQSTSIITFPYGSYSGHYVVGVIYDRAQIRADELTVHTVRELGTSGPVEVDDALRGRRYACESLHDVPSVVRHLEFFAQPKYRIAADRPGSGNTRNMGAVNVLSQLVNGSGPFAHLGQDVFDDYWTHYMTNADAKAAGLHRPPYTNLREYVEYKRLNVSAEAIEQAVADAEVDNATQPSSVEEE